MGVQASVRAPTRSSGESEPRKLPAPRQRTRQRPPEARRAKRKLPSARVRALATHVQRPPTTCCSATRPRAPAGKSRPVMRRSRPSAQEDPRMPDHRHGRGGERAGHEAIARRLADRAPERDRAVVGDRVRREVAPADVRRTLQRDGAGRRGAAQEDAVAHDARVQRDRARALRDGRAEIDGEPRRAQPEALAHERGRERERARAAVQRQRADAAGGECVDLQPGHEARVDRLLREVAVAQRERPVVVGRDRVVRIVDRHEVRLAVRRRGCPPRRSRCGRPSTTRSTSRSAGPGRARPGPLSPSRPPRRKRPPRRGRGRPGCARQGRGRRGSSRACASPLRRCARRSPGPRVPRASSSTASRSRRRRADSSRA